MLSTSGFRHSQSKRRNGDKMAPGKRGRPTGSKNRPNAKDTTEALFYIADALKELNRHINEFGVQLEKLKEVMK